MVISGDRVYQVILELPPEKKLTSSWFVSVYVCSFVCFKIVKIYQDGMPVLYPANNWCYCLYHSGAKGTSPYPELGNIPNVSALICVTNFGRANLSNPLN